MPSAVKLRDSFSAAALRALAKRSLPLGLRRREGRLRGAQSQSPFEAFAGAWARQNEGKGTLEKAERREGGSRRERTTL